MTKITRFCSCGGVMRGTITPDSKAAQIVAIWDGIHSGIGHKPVDSAKAARERRRSEDNIGVNIDNYADLED